MASPQKIKLLELDIDAGAMIKKSAESREELERLKQEAKFLQNQLKEGEQIIDNTRDRLLQLHKQGKGNTDEYKRLEKALEDFNKTQTETSQKLEIVNSGLRKQRADYRMSQRQVDAYNKTVQSQLGIITDTDGSINQLNQAVANNRKIYRELSKEQRENEQIGGRLIKIINEQDKEYKELQKSIGTTQVEVGNYKEQIKEALAESSSFSAQMDTQISQIPVIGSSLSVTIKHLRGYALGQMTSAKATDASSKSLKMFRAALISTGLGAFIVLLGSLIAYLTTAQDGIDKVNRVLTPLKILFQTLLGVAQDLGRELVEMATNPKQALKDLVNYIETNVMNRLKSFGVIIDAIRNRDFKQLRNGLAQAVTGVENVEDKLKGAARSTADLFSEAWERGREIQKLQEDIEQAEIGMISLRAETAQQLKELTLIRRDASKSDEERRDAIQEQKRLTQELVNEESKILEMKIKQMELDRQSNDSGRENEKEYQELLAQRLELQNKITDINLETIERENQLRNSFEARAQKAIDSAIANSKEELDLYIAQSQQKAKTLNEGIQLEETIRDKRLAILQQELNSGKISRTKYETEVLNIKREFLAKQAEMTVEHAQKELDIYIAQNRSLIKTGDKLTQEIVDLEQNRLQEIFNRRMEILEEQRANELISEQDFLLAKLQLQADFLQQEADLKAEYDSQERERRKEQKQVDREIEIEESENAFEEQRIREQQQHEQRLIDLRERLQQGKLTQEQYNKLLESENERHANVLKAINQSVLDSKLAGIESVLGQVSELLGSETEIGKATAIAETTINTYRAAQAAYAALAGIPVVGPALGAFASGVAIAAGVKNVQQITKTKVPKAERGMSFDIGGKRHSEGGTKFYGEDGTAFEAEKGEKMFVLSRRASAALAPLLSNINQHYGGASLTTTSSHLAMGGQILRRVGMQQNLNIDYDIMAAKIAQANANLPAPNVRVAVEDINTAQKDFAQVVNGANL